MIYFDGWSIIKKKFINTCLDILTMAKNKIPLIIFTVSLLIRIPIVFIYGDNTLQNEWVLLVTNLRDHKTLAILNFEDFYLPNLWMPPLYAYFLFLISLFFDTLNNIYISFVLIFQCVLASISIVMFYLILLNFYNKKISLIGAFAFTIFPLNLYASTQISSVTVVIFLLIFFYFFFIRFVNKKKIADLILFSIFAGLLILTRREFFLIFIITNFFLFFFLKIKLKKITLSFIIAIFIVSPYLIRNYLIFDTIIIQAGFGYNMWKSYNPNTKVEGYYILSEKQEEEIKKIPKDKFYRINEDKIFLKESINYIKNDKIKYFKLYFLRLFSYYFIDLNSSQTHYYNIFHLGPNLLLSLFFTLSIFKYNKRSILLNYFLLIFFIYCFLFAAFAIQPRYKLYVVPIQILISMSLFKTKKIN